MSLLSRLALASLSPSLRTIEKFRISVDRGDGPGGQNWKILGFDMFRQPNGSLWCWAAVTSSVVFYYDKVLVCQCEIADTVLRVTKSCCKKINLKTCEDAGTVVPGRCNKMAGLEVGLAAFGHYDLCIVGTPLLSDVQTLIDNNKVVLFRKASAHFVAVDGYLEGTETVQVRDPVDGSSIHFNYSGFAGECTHTYLTK